MSTVSLNHLRVNESGTRLLHNIRETGKIGNRFFVQSHVLLIQWNRDIKYLIEGPEFTSCRSLACKKVDEVKAGFLFTDQRRQCAHIRLVSVLKPEMVPMLTASCGPSSSKQIRR